MRWGTAYTRLIGPVSKLKGECAGFDNPWYKPGHETFDDITRDWPRLQFFKYKPFEADDDNMQKLLCFVGANESYRARQTENIRSLKRKKTQAAKKRTRKDYERIELRTASKGPPQKKRRNG